MTVYFKWVANSVFSSFTASVIEKYLLLLSSQINVLFMCSGVLCIVGQQGSSSAGDQGCLGCLSGPQVQPDPQDTQQTLQGLLFWVRTDTSKAYIHSHTPLLIFTSTTMWQMLTFILTTMILIVIIHELAAHWLWDWLSSPASAEQRNYSQHSFPDSQWVICRCDSYSEHLVLRQAVIHLVIIAAVVMSPMTIQTEERRNSALSLNCFIKEWSPISTQWRRRSICVSTSPVSLVFLRPPTPATNWTQSLYLFWIHLSLTKLKFSFGILGPYSGYCSCILYNHLKFTV